VGPHDPFQQQQQLVRRHGRCQLPPPLPAQQLVVCRRCRPAVSRSTWHCLRRWCRRRGQRLVKGPRLSRRGTSGWMGSTVLWTPSGHPSRMPSEWQALHQALCWFWHASSWRCVATAYL
jgi:hypothetical protein